MVGQASVEHLGMLVNRTDGCCDEYRAVLWNGTSYKTKPNVIVRFGPINGPLTVGGFSGDVKDNRVFGPELGMGWVIGEALRDETVLFIKTAVGDKTLSFDFRPPSSGKGDFRNKALEAGWLYRLMMERIDETLNNLTGVVPDYDEQYDGYELTSFTWFQGFSDYIASSTVNQYGTHLTNLIHDVRTELGVPNLPIIIGELGMHGIDAPRTGYGARVWKMRGHQQRVAEQTRNAIVVPTAPYVVKNGSEFNTNFHYRGRADTYWHIGKALGRGVLQMMNVSLSALSSSAYSSWLSTDRMYCDCAASPNVRIL